MSERAELQRQIDQMRKSIDLQLFANNGEAANRLRDQIGELERQISKLEREAREKRG